MKSSAKSIRPNNTNNQTLMGKHKPTATQQRSKKVDTLPIAPPQRSRLETLALPKARKAADDLLCSPRSTNENKDKPKHQFMTKSHTRSKQISDKQSNGGDPASLSSRADSNSASRPVRTENDTVRASQNHSQAISPEPLSKNPFKLA